MHKATFKFYYRGENVVKYVNVRDCTSEIVESSPFSDSWLCGDSRVKWKINVWCENLFTDLQNANVGEFPMKCEH
jgi:hypothetical protein